MGEQTRHNGEFPIMQLHFFFAKLYIRVTVILMFRLISEMIG